MIKMSTSASFHKMQPKTASKNPMRTRITAVRRLEISILILITLTAMETSCCPPSMTRLPRTRFTPARSTKGVPVSLPWRRTFPESPTMTRRTSASESMLARLTTTESPPVCKLKLKPTPTVNRTKSQSPATRPTKRFQATPPGSSLPALRALKKAMAATAWRRNLKQISAVLLHGPTGLTPSSSLRTKSPLSSSRTTY